MLIFPPKSSPSAQKIHGNIAVFSLLQHLFHSGVDIGKQFLDVYIYEKSLYWQEENNTQGIKSLLKRLSYYNVGRLVMEATGRYEFNLAQAAYVKGIPVCIVTPLSVRRYVIFPR